MLTVSQLLSLALPVGLAAAGLVLGLIVGRTLLARLGKAAASSRSVTGDLLVGALRGPVVLWSTTLGLYLGAELAALPPVIANLVQKTLLVLLIASVTWVVARVAAGTVRSHAVAAGLLPSATLVSNLTRLLVLAIGGLVLLQSLGIAITPMITALGVGGLAVALALQDTLANLFAGIHVLISRQVRPGDFVRLSSGEEGYVQDVTWRYTTIRQLPNNLTVVPNAQLASAVTTNFSLPDRELAVLVPVGVSYDSDLEQVERVTVEVAQEVMREVEGGVPDFTPFIRYHTFGDSSVQFTVILRGREFVAQYLIKHEFVKRLHRRYTKEGIQIPFPIRTIQVQRAQP